jgi:phosphoribosylformylglycinamidine synthase
MIFKANVTVMPQPEILDPQGKAVEQALHQIGIGSAQNVRIGKRIEFLIEADSEQLALEKVTEASKGLLANVILENFKVELELN